MLLTHFVSMLSSEERSVLSRELDALRVSIITLGEDILKYISTFLEPLDRLAYFSAICRSDRLNIYHRRHPTLVASLLVERAYRTFCTSLQEFAERILYVIPQMGQGTVFVLCNWSPFRNRAPRAVMTVSWVATYPHMRIEFSRDLMRRIIGTNLGRYTPVLRLVAYRSVQHDGMFLRINGTPIQTNDAPILWHSCDLLADSSRDARVVLQSPDVQRTIHTETRTK